MKSMEIPDFETLKVDIEGDKKVITIVLNRPEKLNAINQEMVSELHSLMDILEEKATDHLLVFTGAGEKSFVAGADIYELKERQGAEALQAINARLMKRIVDFPFPTIARVQGYCFGGGMELALACDLRIASTNALFAQPEVYLNIIPGAGATYRLPAIVGRGLAREIIFTGARIDGERALEIGLVNRLVAPEELDQALEEMAKKILGQGKEALMLAKRVMNMEEESYHYESVNFAQAHLFASEEKEKRMGDFIEKREKKKKN